MSWFTMPIENQAALMLALVSAHHRPFFIALSWATAPPLKRMAKASTSSGLAEHYDVAVTAAHGVRERFADRTPAALNVASLSREADMAPVAPSHKKAEARYLVRRNLVLGGDNTVTDSSQRGQDRFVA